MNALMSMPAHIHGKGNLKTKENIRAKRRDKMAKQVKGKCRYCGKEYGKAYIIRHLASCKERERRLEKETGKRKCGYFELLIYGKYNHDYWMVIEINETATLEYVDKFLRDIWLECCGHLSDFEINGVSYERYPDPDPFWGREVQSMDCKLKSVFQEGMSVRYRYDFGSTTELVIEVRGYRIGYERKENLLILSRNNPKTFVCGECGKRTAVYIAPELVYDGNPFLCRECSEQEEYEEEFLLNVCNSPRMGVCGYNGSEVYPEKFVPDTDSKEA